jgi:hypothetical protein
MSTDNEPEASLPPYAFVPGGPWPHPRGADQSPQTAKPIERYKWRQSKEYVRGIILFNAGYYWEAHECWEALWHAHGRCGPTADLLKGLIKLAAAGVKVRQRQRRGVVTHARRAAACLAAAAERGGRFQLGLDLEEWIGHAEAVAAVPPDDPAPAGAPVCRVFDFRLPL